MTPLVEAAVVGKRCIVGGKRDTVCERAEEERMELLRHFGTGPLFAKKKIIAACFHQNTIIPLQLGIVDSWVYGASGFPRGWELGKENEIYMKKR